MPITKISSLKQSEAERNQSGASGITLWIDSYSDIFSDFDPRPFSERALSDDFITQVRKVSKESKGKIPILKLLVPVGVRNDEHEKTIRKRIENYFFSMHQQWQEETRATKAKGISFGVAGIALMVIASYIAFLKLSSFYINLVLVIFEPGGWFLFWTGLDHLLYLSKNRKGEIDFYNRMANTQVEFSSYKEI